MASSPLSEPPSSPPRTPSREGSRKRGSYDPSTPRTARRLRSATRAPSPGTSRSPGREGSKRALATARRVQKEVAARLDPDELRKFQNVISQEVIGDESPDNDEDYEDASASDESEQESPTPAIRKGKGPLSRGEKVFLDADRSWTAAEVEEAQSEISDFFATLAESFAREANKNEGWYTRLSGDTMQTLDRADGLAYTVGQVQKHTQDSAKVV